MELKDSFEDLSSNFAACRKTLAAMGDETRQHLILEMLQMNATGTRVGDITDTTDLSRPAVSHHLQILKDSGIVKMRKKGTMTYYYLDPEMEKLEQLSDLLQQIIRQYGEHRDEIEEPEKK